MDLPPMGRLASGTEGVRENVEQPVDDNASKPAENDRAKRVARDFIRGLGNV